MKKIIFEIILLIGAALLFIGSANAKNHTTTCFDCHYGVTRQVGIPRVLPPGPKPPQPHQPKGN